MRKPFVRSNKTESFDNSGHGCRYRAWLPLLDCAYEPKPSVIFYF
jgi:hypothetical protein